ncbi:sigma-70 family RNA polymerase sigma factor [Paracoccus mangrovi]|uniref:Sigma-70 family RNA polymerase sigma factor n=1 Tax=Paracoccus mangrovi TaxID=1715645 RepID=A0ABV7R8X0_9RHOB
MSFSWSGIRDDLARSSSTLQSHRDYRAIRSIEPALQPHADIAALLGALHHGQLDHDCRNTLLLALVRASQGGDRPADMALGVVLLALWPGLDAIRNRCLRRRIGSPDDISSDLLARATETIRKLDLTRVNQIAATVLRNAERDVLRAVIRDDARQQSCADLDPDWIAAAPSWAERQRLRGALRRDLVALIGRDADLVLGVVLDGASQVEMGAVMAVTGSAARKRYQRAMASLALHYASFAGRPQGSTTSTPMAAKGATSRLATG